MMRVILDISNAELQLAPMQQRRHGQHVPERSGVGLCSLHHAPHLTSNSLIITDLTHILPWPRYPDNWIACHQWVGDDHGSVWAHPMKQLIKHLALQQIELGIRVELHACSCQILGERTSHECGFLRTG
eukprot:scaffold33318_cov35-Tisochrysis_lutea.AAC.1